MVRGDFQRSFVLVVSVVIIFIVTSYQKNLTFKDAQAEQIVQKSPNASERNLEAKSCKSMGTVELRSGIRMPAQEFINALELQNYEPNEGKPELALKVPLSCYQYFASMDGVCDFVSILKKNNSVKKLNPILSKEEMEECAAKILSNFQFNRKSKLNTDDQIGNIVRKAIDCSYLTASRFTDFFISASALGLEALSENKQFLCNGDLQKQAENIMNIRRYTASRYYYYTKLFGSQTLVMRYIKYEAGVYKNRKKNVKVFYSTRQGQKVKKLLEAYDEKNKQCDTQFSLCLKKLKTDISCRSAKLSCKNEAQEYLDRADKLLGEK